MESKKTKKDWIKVLFTDGNEVGLPDDENGDQAHSNVGITMVPFDDKDNMGHLMTKISE